MPRESRGEFQSRCELMLAGAKKNEQEPGVQELLVQFETAFTAMKDAKAERAGLRAQQQQSSRNCDQAFATTSDFYSRLRRIFQAKYGTRAEKLAEFGLIPLRPAQKAKPKEIPPEEAQSATQAAPPAADSSTQEVTEA